MEGGFVQRLICAAGTVDKVGGLDNYILGSKAARLEELGPLGWSLRYRLLNSKAVKNMHEDERLKLGIPELEAAVAEAKAAAEAAEAAAAEEEARNAPAVAEYEEVQALDAEVMREQPRPEPTGEYKL